MRRKALIIGNSGNKNKLNEYLEGVNKDVDNYNNFLQSNIGGAWYSHEIVVSLDETKTQLLKKILKIKEELNDFVFVIFSGHGSYSLDKECRKLYIYDKNSSASDNYDFIYEEDLLYMSNKQITIMDTCANIEDDLLKESVIRDSISMEAHRDDKAYYRMVYENAIENSPKQQVILYSSSIDESSNDDSELGGYFAFNLLKVAQQNKQNILSAKEAYFYAKQIVQNKTNNEQNPQCKCVKSNKILPFSIKS